MYYVNLNIKLTLKLNVNEEIFLLSVLLSFFQGFLLAYINHSSISVGVLALNS